ncbi:hypothetical protein EB75_19595 [Mycobacterium sp. ST-F2]|uniref:RHS repeat-associated core domain-containing protein n=1 Tax=Mycobacterium sp. ST-F2 TaxID=1490484 RepID=UPI0009405BD4|nr:RHS repeat-associated core domain-containing protein [Mycobacterium sp. ST-F2]OKH85576.1 hypothetical protein EB75_19595 [Mycobacterium sp. ST-F2]
MWGTTTWTGTDTPLRYPGQYHDPETNLHYNHHRYYQPTTGAYLTPDPLGLAPAPNPYTYPANPTAFADPYGLSPCPSQLLAEDMERHGMGPLPAGHAAHHIVAHGVKAAAFARTISRLAYGAFTAGQTAAKVQPFYRATCPTPPPPNQPADPGGLTAAEVFDAIIVATGLPTELPTEDRGCASRSGAYRTSKGMV